jgi:hypothetical protein
MTTKTRGEAKMVDAPPIATWNLAGEVKLLPTEDHPRAGERESDLVTMLRTRARALVARARDLTRG